MALSISQSVTAIRNGGLTTGFVGIGGTPPYTYAVLSGGAGGTINSTGTYTSPALVNPNPAQALDTIQVTDAASNVATSQILVGSPLQLFCDIIQNQLGLSNGRVYLWDQKITEFSDYDLYVVVQVLREKVFGNTTQYDGSGGGLEANQSCNTMQTLSVQPFSRGPAARDRKEEIIMAFFSDYALSQGTANSFSIARVPVNFVNISQPDGAAIPYRFNIDVNFQYTVPKPVSVPYFGSFQSPTVVVNP